MKEDWDDLIDVCDSPSDILDLQGLRIKVTKLEVLSDVPVRAASRADDESVATPNYSPFSIYSTHLSSLTFPTTTDASDP